MPIAPKYAKPLKPDMPGIKPVSVWHRDIGALLKGGHSKASYRELSVFSRKMSFLLGAGVPIKAALAVVADQLPGRGLRGVLPGLLARVVGGGSFSSAVEEAGAFPTFFCGFVGLGEATAALPQTMEKLADFYDDRAQTKDELTAALVYPIAVSIMMLGIMVLAVTFVLPGYSRIFDTTGAALPLLTRGLLRVSDFMVGNALLVAVGIFLLPVGVVLFLASGYGREAVAGLELRLPLARLGINFRLTQALYMLLTAGLPVSRALPLAEGVMDNLQVKRDIGKMAAQVDMGKTFWEALEGVRYIDPLLVGMARVGEETGRMAQTMEKCQNYYAQAYKHGIKRLNKLVEPVITLVLGVVLGVIMLAIILPTFELATVI